jgi:hypothetical protein
LRPRGGLFSRRCRALAADVAGKWTSEFDSQIGLQKYTFDLKVDGEKVTGKASFDRMGQKGEVDLIEGKLVGDQLSFVETFEMEGNTIRIVYKGTVKGDRIFHAATWAGSRPSRSSPGA